MKTIVFIIAISLVSLNLFSQPLTVSLGSIPATAAGQCTGKAWVNVAGGIAPYSFVWNTGDTTTYIESLCLGTYIVTVTDGANTVSEDTVIFTQESQIIVPFLCIETPVSTFYGFCNGYVTPAAYNGVAPYYYQLFDASTGVLIQEETTQFGCTSNNLCAGNYYYVMTDANNAIFFRSFTIFKNYINIESNAFQINTYLISESISIRVAGVAPINVSVTGNGATQNYTVANSNELITFTPNAPGNYGISLTDNSGNTDQEFFCVLYGNNTSLSTQNPINGCDGSIISNDNIISINYMIPNSNYQITVDNGQLCPGTYNVHTNDMFCQSVMNNQVVTITGPQFDYPELNISSTNTTYNTCSGMAWVEATAGIAPYTYQWTGNGLISNSELVENLCSSIYFIKVLDAANVWTIGTAYVSAESSNEEEIVPGDTIWASQDTCISNIDEVYIYSYTVNATTIDITWAIVQSSGVSYMEVIYDYTITLPGTYNVGLLISCSNSKSLITLNATVQITLSGISPLELNEVSLYPNPAVENLNLSLNNNVSSFDIMSVSGAVLNTYKVRGNQMTINVSTLAEGVYFIRFTNNDGSSFVKKFVK